MKCAVIVFPGSNCDDDLVHVAGTVCRQNVCKVWHKETALPDLGSEDCVFIPGGFAYGDYLRSGAIARFSPIMKSVVDFANDGGRVFGICNGFQVLCEAGLLPGTLLRNIEQKFVSKTTPLRIENTQSRITSEFAQHEVIQIPVAHAEGRFYADDETVEEIEENNQVLFRYCDEGGNTSEEANFNGSLNHIAGIMNEKENVFGMMPHPERAAEEVLGNSEGLKVFQSLFSDTLHTV